MWVRKLRWGEDVVAGVVAAEQFCLSSLKPTLWKNYPEGMSGCSLEICSIWCGCKYWLFYGSEFGWLVCSHNVCLDLIIDVCMLQNHCRVIWGTWIIITIIILNNLFFYFLPILAALNELMCIILSLHFCSRVMLKAGFKLPGCILSILSLECFRKAPCAANSELPKFFFPQKVFCYFIPPPNASKNQGWSY